MALTPGRRLLMGVLVGGVLMLVAHPRSRPMLAYSFQPDRTSTVLRTNPLSNEPFEFFPPDASEMDDRKRFLTALRIVRRLNSKRVTPDERDLAVVRNFLGKSADLDPDNAYWPQLSAAVEGFAGKMLAGLDPWQAASTRGRWETGETEGLQLLWRDLAGADGQRLAWQGVVALDQASDGPGEFIVANVGQFAFGDLAARAASLANAAVILESARSFSTSGAAIRLAHLAVFGNVDPIAALGQRRYEEVKTAFPAIVSRELGEDGADLAVAHQQTVESWQSFYRSGAPIAKSTLRRLRIETLLTATLPSALCMSSLILAAIGLAGALVIGLMGPILNPDRRIIFALGILCAASVWWLSGVTLLSLWVIVITALLCVPQLISRDERIDWRRSEILAVVAVTLLGVALLTANFVMQSTPAINLGSGMKRATLGAIAGLTLSLALPCATVWARLRKVSVFRAIGETLVLVGTTGAMVGFAATIITTPLAIWRDTMDRVLIEQWIRNEPATFRPDAPQ